MKPKLIIPFALLLTSACLSAQNLDAEVVEDSGQLDPIEAAIEAFNNRNRSKSNEVVVVLDPPVAADKGEPDEAVLVTGKQPPGNGRIDIADIPVEPDATLELPAEEMPGAKGLAVRVRTISKGSGKIGKNEQVRLLAPFPAKPLDQAPAGWLLQTSDSVPTMSRVVELSPEKSITLTIRPQVLVPDADQDRILTVQEPGFRASLGYRQSDTVAAVLSDSLERLDKESRQIGNAIDQLQQLIVSLPAPRKAVPIPDGENPAPDQP